MTREKRRVMLTHGVSMLKVIASIAENKDQSRWASGRMCGRDRITGAKLWGLG